MKTFALVIVLVYLRIEATLLWCVCGRVAHDGRQDGQQREDGPSPGSSGCHLLHRVLPRMDPPTPGVMRLKKEKVQRKRLILLLTSNSRFCKEVRSWHCGVSRFRNQQVFCGNRVTVKSRRGGKKSNFHRSISDKCNLTD